MCIYVYTFIDVGKKAGDNETFGRTWTVFCLEWFYTPCLWGICSAPFLILCSTAPGDRDHPWPLAFWPAMLQWSLGEGEDEDSEGSPSTNDGSFDPPPKLEQTHASLRCGASLEKITYHPNLCASPDLRDINLICRNQSLGSGPHWADPYTHLGDEGFGGPVSPQTHSLKLIWCES